MQELNVAASGISDWVDEDFCLCSSPLHPIFKVQRRRVQRRNNYTIGQNKWVSLGNCVLGKGKQLNISKNVVDEGSDVLFGVLSWSFQMSTGQVVSGILVMGHTLRAYLPDICMHNQNRHPWYLAQLPWTIDDDSLLQHPTALAHDYCYWFLLLFSH